MGNTPIWISRYYDGQGIPNLTQTSLIKCYNFWVTKGKPTLGRGKFTPPPSFTPPRLERCPLRKITNNRDYWNVYRFSCLN